MHTVYSTREFWIRYTRHYVLLQMSYFRYAILLGMVYLFLVFSIFPLIRQGSGVVLVPLIIKGNLLCLKRWFICQATVFIVTVRDRFHQPWKPMSNEVCNKCYLVVIDGA